MDNSEIVSKLGGLEEKTKSHSHRIKTLEEKSDSIPRLETLMEMVIETNKEQSSTLKHINENLTGLNTEMKNMGKEVSKLGNRVQKLEESDDSKKIDLGKLGKDVIYKVVPTIIGTLIITWLLLQFGWSK